MSEWLSAGEIVASMAGWEWERRCMTRIISAALEGNKKDETISISRLPYMVV